MFFLMFPSAVCGLVHLHSYLVLITGGKGVITQWVHGELIVSFETIHPVNTHQVCVEYF